MVYDKKTLKSFANEYGKKSLLKKLNIEFRERQKEYENIKEVIDYVQQLDAPDEVLIISKEDKLLHRLQSLKKWDCSTGDSGPFASQIDWEEDDELGEWVRLEDVKSIINDFKEGK